MTDERRSPDTKAGAPESSGGDNDHDTADPRHDDGLCWLCGSRPRVIEPGRLRDWCATCYRDLGFQLHSRRQAALRLQPMDDFAGRSA